MRTFVNTIGIVFVLFVLVFFCMQNTACVQLNLYSEAKLNLPLWGLVLGPFFIGIIMGSLLDVLKILNLKKELRRLKQELRSSGMTGQ